MARMLGGVIAPSYDALAFTGKTAYVDCLVVAGGGGAIGQGTSSEYYASGGGGGGGVVESFGVPITPGSAITVDRKSVV